MNGGILKRGMRLWVCVVMVLLGGGYVVCLFEGRGEAAELAKEEKNDGELYNVKGAIAITAHNHIHQKSHENEEDEEEELGISEFVAKESIIFQRAATRDRQRREVVEVTSIGKDQTLLNVAEVMRKKGRLEKELAGPAAAAFANVDDHQEMQGGMISVKKEVWPNAAEEDVGADSKGARSSSSSEKKLRFKPLNMGGVREYRTSAEKKKKKTGRRTYEASVYAGEGQFLTVLRIGTPPVSFTAILDTGSDLVWRQCQPCSQCYPQTDYGFPIFDPASSSTFRKASCENPLCPPAQIYGGSCTPASGSSLVNTSTCSYDSLYDDPPAAFTRGDLSFDTLFLSDTSGRPHHLPNFAFGCSHASHGPYNFVGSGGIVGFGEGKLSLPSQLGISKFSYCLQSITAWSIHHQPSPHPQQQQQTALSSSSPSPLQQHSSLSPSLATPLLFGDDAYLGDGDDIQSTPIVEQGYIVKLLGISVGGHRLNVSRSVFVNGRTLIDTGTTFTTLPTQAFHALYSAFKAFIPLKPWHDVGSGPLNLSLCYTSLPSPIPSLAFHFKGATLHLRPHNYFVLIDSLYCLALSETRYSQIVYGNVQQQDFHIIYDLHSRLISFKPTSCASLHRR